MPISNRDTSAHLTAFKDGTLWKSSGRFCRGFTRSASLSMIFFSRAVAVTVAGQKFRRLSHQDLMLVLCVHAAKHAWMQLSWLCDIVQLARSRSPDWEALRAQATRLGIERIVAVSFLLAHKLLGASLPL